MPQVQIEVIELPEVVTPLPLASELEESGPRSTSRLPEPVAPLLFAAGAFLAARHVRKR